MGLTLIKDGDVAHQRVLPGAELVTLGKGPTARAAMFGAPVHSLKVLFQRKLPVPDVIVLPDEFFRNGIVQVGLEFLLYFDLFVRGKAFRAVAPNERLVVIGTSDQLRRARRVLEVTLTGFALDEMRTWRTGTNGRRRRALTDREMSMLRRYRAWFGPKSPDVKDLKAFVAQVAAHQQTNEPMPLNDYVVVFGGTPAPIVQRFLAAHGNETLAGQELRTTAYESAFRTLDDLIEWRPFDADGTAPLFPPVHDESLGSGTLTVHRKGDNTFAVSDGTDALLVDCNFTESQAPYLITLPPEPQVVEADAFKVVCLGSDSGFEQEHPTTGFAICLNGQWVIVDAPLCTSQLLANHGISVDDVRAVIETHGHEDHMGSAMHFILECLAAGRSFTYVAAEPVFRTCVAKVAAVLDITEEEAVHKLEGVGRDAGVGDPPRGGVIRVRPGEPLRLLGATWYFAWTVHPIPTTGFRVEFEYGGRTYRVAYSSDTNRISGFAGLDAMAAEGFYDPADDPFEALVHGDEDLVFWEAGGSNGDPIHVDAGDWTTMCARRGVDPPVVFMHVHPMPPGHRDQPIARPGMEWRIAEREHVAVADVAALDRVVRSFPLRDPSYWLGVLLTQGEVRRSMPGAAIVVEGEPGDAWYVVLRGTASIRVGGVVVGTLGSGAFFGELALLEQPNGRTGKRRATVRAVGPTDVLRIPATTFRDFVFANDLASFFATFWDRVGSLRKARLFVGFPHHVLAALASRATVRTLQSGEVLIHEGTTGDELFVVQSGTVRIFRTHPTTGEEEQIGDRGPGEVLGEVGVLYPGTRRTATVRAETDVTVLVLTREQIDEVVAGQLPLELRIVALMRERGLAAPEDPAVATAAR